MKCGIFGVEGDRLAIGGDRHVKSLLVAQPIAQPIVSRGSWGDRWAVELGFRTTIRRAETLLTY